MSAGPDIGPEPAEGAQVVSQICLRHLIKSRAWSQNRIYSLRKDLYSIMRAQHGLSYLQKP